MMSFIKSKQSSMPDDLKHVNVRNAPTKKKKKKKGGIMKSADTLSQRS